ncbi:acyl-CoA dehydrogenase family protein [Brevibacillus massiliensis]|uniref:acyl-CoA dehydrogenase family protein n=1 Tax=Brevibacillus massiliensis TaxID=1118054 RepID=UPI0002E22732
MVDFSFTGEQEELRRVLRDFSRSELLPYYMQWDRQGAFSRETWKKMGRLGITGLRVPAEYGGSEADCVTAGIAAEEIGRGDFNMTYAVMLNALIAEILGKHASEELKRSWLPPLACGDKIIGIAITEPGAGSDAAGMRTKAERRGDAYLISCEKSGISMATVADAFIVFARTGAEPGARGVSAFLVPADLPGIERSRYEDMGNVPIGRGSLYFDKVEIPASSLIGEENRGFYQVMNGFDLSRILIGLQCLGAAMQTLEETIDHVKTRHAFGQPLARFEGVSFSDRDPLHADGAGSLAVLSWAVAAGSRQAAHDRSSYVQVVGPQSGRGDHSPVPAAAWALRVYQRDADRTAAAGCDRTGDRGRHGPDSADRHCPGAVGKGISPLLKTIFMQGERWEERQWN